MLRFYSLAVVIVFFLVVNFYLLAQLLLISPEVSTVKEEVVTQVVEGGVDPISMATLGGDHLVDEESNITFDGSATLVDGQGTPVSKAVVTLQLVAPGKVEIGQFTTDTDGVAKVIYEWDTFGSYRIEILDIIGDGYEYDKTQNAVRVITGRVTSADIPQPEPTIGASPQL